jgi:hypothetical protein
MFEAQFRVGRITMKNLLVVYGMSVDLPNDIAGVGFLLLLDNRQLIVNVDRQGTVAGNIVMR